MLNLQLILVSINTELKEYNLARIRASMPKPSKGLCMRSNRHVPYILGFLTIGLSLWLIFGFSSWWRFIPSMLLFIFGWVTLKTAIFASDIEIKELTSLEPASEETIQKFKDRI